MASTFERAKTWLLCETSSRTPWLEVLDLGCPSSKCSRPDPASRRRPPSTGAAPPSSKRRRSAQPVSTLTPYNDTWTIKARVAKKEPLRSYEKDGTSKSVFSMELVDDQVLYRLSTP